MSGLHVLHLLDHSLPLHSGYSFRTLAILREQRALGYAVTCLTGPKQGECAASCETLEGFTFQRTAVPRGLAWRMPFLHPITVMTALRGRIMDVARQVRPDLLHAHSPALTGWAALSAGRRLGLPVVYEVRAFWEDAAVSHGTAAEGGVRYRLSRRLESRILAGADQVTTICEGLRQEMMARGVSGQRITVIPNAVAAERFSPQGEGRGERLRHMGWEGRTLIGFAGSFYAYEGLALLLAALPAVIAVRPDVLLLLMGGGPEEEALKVSAERLGILDHVRFMGRLPHETMRDFYDLADLFVYPRLSLRLTDLVTPLKPLEAMAAGKAVVASDVGGHRELIVHGENGLLFPAGDGGALARCLLELLQHEGAGRALGERARRWVLQERSWEKSVARYQGVYAAAMGARHP